MMGATLTAPSPSPAADEIPSFDVTHAAPGPIGTYPQLPLSVASTTWIGSGNDTAKQLTSVVDDWETPEQGSGSASTVVSEWIKALNWTTMNGAGFSITGSSPVVSLETYAQSCFAVPLLTTA
jgi:hypothetical protein